ncbi:MAG: DUF3137 domain-containing protein [Muribaculaceae bacterium]|nr:DUF3137 domain-containing protein [Muribaculaceae bacterium]
MRKQNPNNKRIIIVAAAAFLLVIGIIVVTLKAQNAILLQEERILSYEGEGVPLFYRIGNIFRLIVSGIAAFLILYFAPKFMKYKQGKEQEYDEKIVQKAVAQELPGATFIREAGFSPQLLYEYGILPSYDSYQQNGILRYQKNGREQTISNLYLMQRHEDSKERVSYKVSYRGQAYTAHYRTMLPGAVRILPTKMIPVINRETIGCYPSRRREESKIETENVLFNNQFDVYATDEQSAFFVLNPVVIEQLLEMKRHYEQFGIFIQDDEMVITLETDCMVIPKRFYQKEQEAQDISIVREEVRKLIQTADLLEDALNGSIQHNFTNLRRGGGQR